FKDQQLENRTETMIKQIQTLLSTSSYLSEDDWLRVREQIQKTLNEWRFSGTEVLYVVYQLDIPRIIASSHINYDELNGQNALAKLDPTLILSAYNGEMKDNIKVEPNESAVFKHLAYPVFDEV